MDNFITRATKGLGSTIIKAASEQSRKKHTEKVVAQVTQIAEMQNSNSALIDHLKFANKWFQMQLDAVESDEFDIHPYSGQIIYHDKKLNYNNPEDAQRAGVNV